MPVSSTARIDSRSSGFSSVQQAVLTCTNYQVRPVLPGSATQNSGTILQATLEVSGNFSPVEGGVDISMSKFSTRRTDQYLYDSWVTNH